MSKAFLPKDAEDSQDNEELARAPIQEKRNYMTPAGARRLQAEFQELKFKERPEVVKVVEWAAGNGDRSENGDYIYGKRRLREIDKRLQYLSKRLDTLEVVDPTKIQSREVLFGASVTIRDEDDKERTFAIVGVDEADAAKGKISWVSPLAQALFKSKVGDQVQVHAPRGVQEVEIVAIVFREIL
jgi:transcription elongation factor GreB